MQLPVDFNVEQVMERSILVKHIFKLYVEAKEYDELFAKLEDTDFTKEAESELSFAFRVTASGKHIE